ncbi:MAG: tetratricopeptide repeat protein, partial [Sandaracinaceae bacterium]
PLAVIVGAAHAAYALGQDESAIDLYGQVLAREPSIPKVARRLAHALARSGERLDRAEQLVERALSEAGDGADPELLLIAARVSAARGGRRQAKRLLRRAEGLAGSSEALLEEVRAHLLRR